MPCGDPTRGVAVKQKTTGILFAVSIGLLLAWYSYQRINDPRPGLERQQQENLVLEARAELRRVLRLDDLAEIVDPLAPNRVAGRVYIFTEGEEWQVSGYYRRSQEAEWLPWLMLLDTDGSLLELKVPATDPMAARLAAEEPRIVVR